MTRAAALLSVFACAHGVSTSQCMYGATIDNALFQASFLVFENVLMLRTRLSQTALLASTLHCMGIAQDEARRGLQMFVMESNETQCEFARLYDPLAQVAPVTPSALTTSNTTLTEFPMAPRSSACTPETYEANPWACMPGDWSGKFGELTLGLDHLLYKLTNRRTNSTRLRRFLSSNSSVLRSHLSVLEEEVRVHIDQLAIPPCQLEGKYIGLFCEDGHLIGCAKFDKIIPSDPGPRAAMEAGTRFLIRSLQPSTCVKEEPPNDPKPIENRHQQEPSWTDRLGKELGNLPDYVSSWWEDVKRKGKEAWKASQR